MELQIKKLSEMNAKQICNWRYQDEYSIYNYPNWAVIKSQNWAIADEIKRNQQFCSITNENSEFVGYFRLIENKNCVTLGLGLNPTYCGLGYGNIILPLIIDYATKQFPQKPLQLEVREFNQRAIRCYQKSGFQEIKRYFKTTSIGNDVFLKMEYDKNLE